MPKVKKGESVGGYFRKLFRENPEWLRTKSNDQVVARWKADHPGKEFTSKIRANLSNIKSTERKKGRIKSGKKGGRKAGPVTKANSADDRMEHLELYIDRCLSLARQINEKKLHSVISHLRNARNEVVWELGK
jgi:hypothetical protein